MNTTLICVGCQKPLRDTGLGIDILGGPGIECRICKTQYLADFIVRDGSSKPVLVLQPLPPDWEQRYEALKRQGGPLFPPENINYTDDPYTNGITPQDFENGIMPNVLPSQNQVNAHFNKNISPHSSSKLVGKSRTSEEFKNLIKESLTPSEFIKKISTAE